MKMETEQTTLQIHTPAGKVLRQALATLLIALLLLEGGLRLAVTSGWMPDPGPGTTNADLNIKMPMLDALAQREGGVDCIFLGSSMTNDDVDPEVFASRYGELSGTTVTCFNFAVATLTGEIAGGLSQILAERYHPDLLVYGTSARDYSKELGARALKDDGWFRYQLGEWNLTGWLKEYSMLYRTYLKILSDFNPANREYAISVRQNTSPYGHFVVHVNVISLEGQNTIHEETLLKKDFAGLKRLVSLDGAGVSVVVMEIPVHEAFLPEYVNEKSEDYYRLFFDPATEILTKAGIPFIHTLTGTRFTAPDEEWADLKHLNNKGSARFSAWLADEIWQLEQAGVITWGED
ncbi:MAG: hypothetical protein C0391_09185 [Anaerolinea sp.]|nr:hypothetical protein [Anaerolinea sp.]